MALQMLGSKYCIESLREDVNDLQESVTDVFSRAGPVRTPSWKYPDKIASDIDMTELLDIYDYSDDEEDRQIAHIVLLELVIDRLILLLHSMSKFADQSLLPSNKASHKSNQGSSVGLVVKKFWNKLVHAHAVLGQAHSDNKQLKRKINDLENSLNKESSQRHKLEQTAETLHETLISARPPLAPAKLEQVLSRTSSTLSISRDECNKSTQTFETAFVPCEACDSVQQSLRSVGDNVISMCQRQGLPSKLVQCRKEMAHIDWLTSSDVTRWAAEQTLDMNRLNKHLSDFDQVRDDLQAEKTKVKALNAKLAEHDKEMKLERQTQTTQRKHFESKIEAIEKIKDQVIGDVKRRSDEILKNKQQLERQLGDMKGQLTKQKQIMNEIESAKASIEQQLHESLTNNAEAKRLQQNVDDVTSQLSAVTSQLHESQQQLSREKAMNKSSRQHNESIQGKQESLLRRLDEIDTENDELRTEINELEESKEKLQEQLETAKDEKRKMVEKQRESQALITQLKRDKSSIEQSLVDLQQDIQQMEKTLQQAREQQELLLQYPDLNGPVNPDLQGTGDIARDMENQVKANSARITLLEEQNRKLRSTITKLLQSRPLQPPTGRTTSEQHEANGPVPLWRQNTPREAHEIDRRDVSKQSTFVVNDVTAQQHIAAARESFVVGRGGGGGRFNERLAAVTSSASQRGVRSRPGSAAKTHGLPSHVSTYSSATGGGAKRTGQLQKMSEKGQGHARGGRPPAVNDYTGLSAATAAFTCDRCDKMYDSKKDLDIHRTYCRV